MIKMVKGKGEVKEYFGYNCDSLYYEGEYLNGKKNGNGKEYAEEGKYLSYEGKFSNGRRNGKGKEYYYEDLR